MKIDGEVDTAADIEKRDEMEKGDDKDEEVF
jgi:hypothetical protein